MHLLFVLATAPVLAVWLALSFLCVRAVWRLEHLEDDTSSEPTTWPSVSLLVPARDEAHGLESALRSKLSIDYPALEVVFINDRSSDETGAIAERLAKEDPRLKVVHISQLPAGWLGKVHALFQGAKVAQGDWLLPTDADIHFAKDTLKLAMRRSLARGHDVLAAFPRFHSATLLIDAVLSDFARTVLAPMQVDRIEDKASPFGVGVGVFTLIRRAAYDASPGWEWLKLEVADDVTLGMMLKQSGARCSLVMARKHLALTMYPTWRSLVRGIEKSACAISRYQPRNHLPIALGMLAVDVVPWLALGVGLHSRETALCLLGGAASFVSVASGVLAVSVLGIRAWRGLLSPIGGLVLHLLILGTGLRNYIRGSVAWRDTRYSIAELRAGMRFQMPWQRASTKK